MRYVDFDLILRLITANYQCDRTKALVDGKISEFQPVEDTYFKVLELVRMATKTKKEPEQIRFPLCKGSVDYSAEWEERFQAAEEDAYQEYINDLAHKHDKCTNKGEAL